MSGPRSTAQCKCAFGCCRRCHWSPDTSLVSGSWRSGTVASRCGPTARVTLGAGGRLHCATTQPQQPDDGAGRRRGGSGRRGVSGGRHRNWRWPGSGRAASSRVARWPRHRDRPLADGDPTRPAGVPTGVGPGPSDRRSRLRSNLPLPTDSLDVVLTVDTIYFMPDLAPPFAELARVVRPRGRVVVCAGDPTEMAKVSVPRTGSCSVQ